MTIRLFDENPYDGNFQAIVTFLGEGFIILDKTLFYPLSGNQQCDKGTLNGVEVSTVEVDVQDKHHLDFNAPIKHFIDTKLFTQGQQVNGVIDESIRRKTMRLHTASHLVEHYLSLSADFISVEGSFVNDKKDRTDYCLAENLTADSLKKLEDTINEFIGTGEPVSFKQQNNLRVWCCRDIQMPCCGTHVKNISEIGEIKLTKKNKGKGINRIEIYLSDENK
ncbi:MULTISPECIES: alanyl-tRNA editing protein [Enterobacterales]|uniref:alanyl-tRNA editing protein n=1 Tax=Enterobacterales TaxID=91347 RepID=UPI002EDAFE46